MGNMSMEDRMIRNIDRNRQHREVSNGPDYIKTAYDRAHAMLNDPTYSIQSPQFIGLYGKENVLNDMREVKRLKEQFDRNNSPAQKEALKASEVFEAIVLDQSEMNEWLGSNVTVLKTSAHDDVRNGIDMVAEWQEPESEPQVLALAVDVTFSTMALEKKFHRIRSEIDNGEMGTIKYFKTADGSFTGRRDNVPKVVIGVSKKCVQELAGLWVRRDNKALAEHPVQRAILNEIVGQLRNVVAYATARNQTKIADAYRRTLSMVERMIQSKKPIPLGELENDPVFNAILSTSKHSFR